jgi:tetratricopeptide (TPR) repeat protein
MDQTARDLEHKATILRDQGKSLEAIKTYQNAKELYLMAGNLKAAAGCQHMIGVCFKIENDLKQALPAYEQAIEDYRTAGDKLGPGRVARDIGVMYEYHDKLKPAEKYLLQSKKELEALPPDTDIVQHVSEAVTRDAELGITLAKLGKLATRSKDYDKAEKLLTDGLTLIRTSGHPHYEITALLHLASLYDATGHSGRMLANLEAALGLMYEHNLQTKHTRRLAQIWGLMAHAYLRYANKATARHFAKKSLAIIDSLSKDAQKPLIKDVRADILRILVNK